MKHFYRIISAWLLLSLLLSIGTMANAQHFPDVERNIDSSYNRTVVLETFKSFIETAPNLPTDEEKINEFVQNFFRNLPGDTYRKGDAKTEALNDEEMNQLGQECIKLLEQKAQIVNEQKELEKKKDKPLTYREMLIWGGAAPGFILVVVVVILLVRSSKKKKEMYNNIQSPYTTVPTNSNNTGTNDLIIRRKTNSVMHKQSLDDVVGNGNYMVINCSDISNDTAVGTMYIKNSCILDIYNMYAEDLRNPDNPKEDGCMVLGRWVYDEKLDEYAVSLEEIVKPGDDAVFTEYELDFGGKIKLKVSEKLRKLRRETNLQYDLTCWVHSHPGLGVFFSNTDCSLHILHKHPTHPKFLTAIVIDILTPQQELGIFTFKHDMSINSKADLKQLYSLEEWYKWAVESKRNSAKFEEHYNTLKNAKSRNNQCYNVQLSNSPIIDIDQIAINQDSEHIYFVHGFSSQQSDQTTNMAARISSVDTLADNELVGCFLLVTHRSFPTIKNAVANYLDRIKFVLVYSSSDGMLTTIPVINKDLCGDESYYGEQPLEDLKIWTRRKR